jgi:hypothetical protein
MVRGIHRQWKQPISFTFLNGPIKAADLKKIITGAITACQNIGFKVVATVCDQGSANQAAINSLLANTKKSVYEKAQRTNISVLLLMKKKLCLCLMFHIC